MKLIINKNQINVNPEQFLRRAGYAYLQNRHNGDDSFVRRLGANFYPRLHVYYKYENDNIIFNIHLDQKQASYAGSHMHSGEYDGEIVEAEVERLRQFTGQYSQPVQTSSLGLKTREEINIKVGDLDDVPVQSIKKSWWSKFFS